LFETLTRNPAVASVGRPCRLHPNTSVVISLNEYSSIHAMVTLLYQTLTLGNSLAAFAATLH